MFFAIMVLQTQQSEMLLSRLFSVGELCSNAHIAMKLSVPILTVHAICVALFTKYLCLWLGYSHINLSVVSGCRYRVVCILFSKMGWQLCSASLLSASDGKGWARE